MAEEEKKKKVKPTKLEKWFKTLHRLQKTVGRVVFPFKRQGHIEPYNDRAYIIVGNHRSVMDVIPAAIITDRPVHFMAKKEIGNKRIGRWFLKKCECIPVNRDGNDVHAVMQAMKYLKNGENVCIFPEGTRNKTEDIFLPLQSGAAALSIKTKTPIILSIQCKKMKVFKKQHYYYSEPFEFSDYYGKKLTNEDIAECDEILRQKMLECYYKVKGIDESGKKKKSEKAK